MIFAPDVPPENVQVVAVEELVFSASSQTRAASSLSAVHETQLRRCNTRRRWREHERPCDRVIAIHLSRASARLTHLCFADQPSHRLTIVLDDTVLILF